MDRDRHPEKSLTDPETRLPAPSGTSCRFKRQIKLFEKLKGQSEARQNPDRLSLAGEDEDKPTFFFGASALAQLVDPIGGDGHFDDLAV